MLGKLAAAFIGEHVAGRDKATKGAIVGVVVETVIKKVVPTVAAIAILAFAYKKAKDFVDEEFGGEEPNYSPEEPPPSPAG